MRYLFGDSTESALEQNYLAFLRDALDFGVAVLQADAGLVGARERKSARERAAHDAIHAVEEFGRSAAAMADPVAKRAADTPLGRTAASVSAAAADAVRREIAVARAGLQADLDLIEAEAGRLRAKCVAALGALLSAHDLPDAESVVAVRWVGGAYEARLRQRTEWGLEATIELDIGGSSPFAHDLRVDRIADGVEVHAPEAAGWLKKEMKMLPHKLSRHHVTEVIVDADGVTMKLRASTDGGPGGFDITVAPDGAVSVRRPEDSGATFDTDERDQEPLRTLAGRLEEALLSLSEHRRGTLLATIDEVPLTQHAHPRVMVERLVAAMTPTVVQIAKHSLAPNELVLKRLLAGDRREEIFVSKAELAAKLDPLPPALRKAFAPLGIVPDEPEPRPAKRATAPPPLPGVPPPTPPPRVSAEQTAAAVDNALRDLEDS